MGYAIDLALFAEVSEACNTKDTHEEQDKCAWFGDCTAWTHDVKHEDSTVTNRYAIEIPPVVCQVFEPGRKRATVGIDCDKGAGEIVCRNRSSDRATTAVHFCHSVEMVPSELTASMPA